MKQQIKIHFLIAIFLLGHAHISAQELAPSKGAYKPGEDVVISFSGGPGNAKDWVGIYNEGQTPGDVNSTDYKYVDGKTSGELVFDPLPVGKYEAHLLENDGYEILASTTFEVSDEVDVPKVSLSKAEYEIGEVIEISFSGGPGNKLDWIGVYQEGQTPGEVSSTDFEYVVGKTSGSFVFDSLPVGKYEAHLFEDDSYDILATESFNIKEAPVANKAPVVVDRSLEVNEEGSVSITLTGSDEDGDDLSFTVLSQPKNGALSGTAPNLTYSPKANYSGSDSFTFKASDGKADSNTATVAIRVIKGLTLPEGVYFEEDFDGLTLEAFESDSEKDGDGTDWAAQGPTGWVMRKGEGHGPTEVGEAVKEFDGWTFFDPVSWNATAGQLRGEFKKGKGVIAVADSDEYDDKADTAFDASLETPSIDISGAVANTLILTYDSSWRKEPQAGSVRVIYDGGEEIELLKLDEASPDLLNETVELALNNPAGAKSAVVKWDYQGQNNWWWAIDNVGVYEEEVNNSAPAVAGQSVNVDEDGSVSITLEGSDADGDGLSFTVVSQPESGTLSGTAPNLAYSPKANYSGSDSFTFKANDGSADSNTATVTISVVSVNDKPVVAGQSVEVNEDEEVSITLTGSDVDGDELTFTVVSQPESGTLSGTAPNLAYSPKANYSGSDSFTFKANDGSADSNTATVTISVVSVNDKPVVSGQSVEVNEDEEVSITLTGSDEDGDDLTFTVVSQPKNGALSGTAPNLTYSPKANYSGSDSLTFKTSDGEIDSNTATVTISVASVNDKPVVAGQSVEVNEGEPVSITLTGSDEDGDDLTFTVVSQPESGTLSGTTPNLAYSPKANYSGSDSFTFKANDGSADSNTATVTVSVVSVNDKPVVAGQSVNVDEDGSVSITLEGSDADGDGLSFTVVSQPKNGALSGTAPNLTYSPKANYSGSDSFTFKTSDGEIDSNTATVTISVASVNDEPVVAGQSVEVNEGEPVSITLTGSDEDGDDLTFTVVSQPESGTLSGTAPNLTYSPKANYSGSDSFMFKASDGEAGSNTATITISVASVNDKPVVAGQSVNVDEDGSVSITLEGSDADGDGLSFTVVSQPKNGALSGTAPNLTYSPKANYSGSDSFTFKTSDGEIDSNTATVTISVASVNDKPVVAGQSVEVNEGEPVSITLTGSDEDGDDLTFTVVSQPESGTLSGTAPNLTYSPKANYSGSDSFTFKANDGTVDSSTATVSITETKKEVKKTLKFKFGQQSNETQVEFNIWDSVTVEYSGGQGNSKDWIGTRPVGESEIYTGTRLSSEFKSGTIELGSLKPGLYDLIWVNEGYMKANAKFRVLANDQGATNPDTSWSIFVYGNADHNLTPGFLADIEEMKRAGGNENFNIVVLSDLDGSEASYIKNSGKCLDKYGVKEEHKYKVTRGVILDSDHKIVEVLPEQNTDDPHVLADFLDWGITNYPADRYGLVLWNHGGQWGGYGGDKDNGQKSYSRPNMKSPDIKDVVLDVLAGHGLEKLDFLSFDTCLMGGAEILADIHQICDVYIACPEIDYGDGWDYTASLAYLKAFPDITNIEFAKKEVQFWGAHHSRSQSDRSYKFHAAYDMKYYGFYNNKLKAFTAAILSETKTISSYNVSILAKIRREAIHFSNSGRAREGSADITKYIDLGYFAEEIAKHFTGKLKTASLELVHAIKKMIIAKTAGSKSQKAVGLSIYYPIDGDANWTYSSDVTMVYNSGTEHEINYWQHLNFLKAEHGGDNWLKYLGKVKNMNLNDISPPQISSGNDGSRSGRQDDGAVPVEEKDYYIATLNDPTILEFEVTDGIDAYSAYVSLVSNELTGNPNEYVYLGEIGSALLDGEGEYEVEWDATMPIISLADSDTYDPIYLGGWAMEAGSDLYVSLADYQAPGSDELTSLILITRFDEDGYGIIDNIMADTVETGSTEEITLSSTSIDMELETGGKLWPVYYMEELTEDDEYESWFVSDEDVFITIPENGKEGLEISFQTVEEGNYTVEVQTFDYFDNGSEILSYFVHVPEEKNEIKNDEPTPELSIGIENGNVVVSWPLFFMGYSLEWTAELGGGNLLNVPANEINIFNGKYSFTHQPVDQTRFYRLIKR